MTTALAEPLTKIVPFYAIVRHPARAGISPWMLGIWG